MVVTLALGSAVGMNTAIWCSLPFWWWVEQALGFNSIHVQETTLGRCPYGDAAKKRSFGCVTLWTSRSQQIN